MTKSSAEILLAKKTYSANDVEKLIAIERNKILNNKQILSAVTSDPAQEEKITALEKEIKELKETVSILEKQKLNAKSENIKIKMELFDLKEKTKPKEPTYNARGAGRKQKLNNEIIKQIKYERKTYGSKISDLAKKFDISTGLVSKIINN